MAEAWSRSYGCLSHSGQKVQCLGRGLGIQDGGGEAQAPVAHPPGGWADGDGMNRQADGALSRKPTKKPRCSASSACGFVALVLALEWP